MESGLLCVVQGLREILTLQFYQTPLKWASIVFEGLIVKLKSCKRRISEAWLYFWDDRALTVVLKYIYEHLGGQIMQLCVLTKEIVDMTRVGMNTVVFVLIGLALYLA